MSINSEHSITIELFCYGTLLVPEIMLAVSGRSVPGKKAYLENYRIGTVLGQVFPGMIPMPGATVHGELFSITERESILLDDYEGSLYTRNQVIVKIDDGSQQICTTYILKHHFLLSEEKWELEEFVEKHKNKYLTELCE